MASRIKNEMTSLDVIKECINTNKSFVLEAGAGSGKTWTLVETIKYVIDRKGKELERYHQKIGCITYTNVAKNEIIERTYDSNMIQVSTIHEFLWGCIKNYQIEMKKILCDMNKEKIVGLEEELVDRVIEYENYRKLEAGIISHDDVIKIADRMFQEYDRLKKIICDAYPYIFIDEYQDTQKETINILINSLLQYNGKKNDFVIGFYGDAMQKIYNTGIGDISSVIMEGTELVRINKIENYRCSKSVIRLLNKIRTDLTQVPATHNNEGEIKFLYVPSERQKNDISIDDIISKLSWGQSDEETTKVLFLTHRKIAQTANFFNLYNVFNNRYKSFGNEKLNGKEDKFIEFMIDGIEKMVLLYEENHYEDFWKVCSYPIKSQIDKSVLSKKMKTLIEMRKTNKVKQIIEFVHSNGLLSKTEKIVSYEQQLASSEEKEVEFYTELMELEYKEIIEFNQYLRENSLFSTKHGVKGAEFDNVIVVIDDSDWNQYSFKDVFLNNTKSTKYKRTLNLLYVCCSRSKNNLALIMLSSIDEIGIDRVKEWFGDKNVIEYSI